MTKNLQAGRVQSRQVVSVRCCPNVIATDFDDLRTADIPEVFYGFNYITLKLICSDYAQNLSQMENRGDGLIDTGLLKEQTVKIMARPLLVNEFAIDVRQKAPRMVLDEATALIDFAEVELSYAYHKPPQEMFYSWVWDKGLRTV